MPEKVTYAQVGDNYATKDPVHVMSHKAASSTAANLVQAGFSELADSRGGSAYVWQQGRIYMAAVLECLGTKNLVADAMRQITGKTCYDVIAHDTVATFINDLATVGAKPLVVNAYWAVEDNTWLSDEERMKDFIKGWKDACNLAGASWGGGETPTLKGIIRPGTVDLAGSAVGIISSKKRLITENLIKSGDRIILLKSNGLNANGISLTRALAKKLSRGYRTKIPNGQLFGEAILQKSNIYASMIQNLLDENIQLHYIANITGHGLRKIMRPKRPFTYIIEKIIDTSDIFSFIQQQAGLSDYEMYETYNMGMDYALYLPEKNVPTTLKCIKKLGFSAIEAGYVTEGDRKVLITPRNLTYLSDSLTFT